MRAHVRLNFDTAWAFRGWKKFMQGECFFVILLNPLGFVLKYVRNIGLQWSTEIQPKSFFGNHLTSWPGFDRRDGKFLFLLFYLIWLSLSSESSQLQNFAKILSSFLIITCFWLKILFSQRVFNILASWVKLNKKVKKEICHPGDRTQAKKSNDFQKMISVDHCSPMVRNEKTIYFNLYLVLFWIFSNNYMKKYMKNWIW